MYLIGAGLEDPRRNGEIECGGSSSLFHYYDSSFLFELSHMHYWISKVVVLLGEEKMGDIGVIL